MLTGVGKNLSERRPPLNGATICCYLYLLSCRKSLTLYKFSKELRDEGTIIIGVFDSESIYSTEKNKWYS